MKQFTKQAIPRNSIQSFMIANTGIINSGYYDFFSKYMLKDYKSFINIRKKEVKELDFFKSFFYSSFSFSDNEANYQDWLNCKKVLEQSEMFISLSTDLYNPFKKYMEALY